MYRSHKCTLYMRQDVHEAGCTGSIRSRGKVYGRNKWTEITRTGRKGKNIYAGLLEKTVATTEAAGQRVGSVRLLARLSWSGVKEGGISWDCPAGCWSIAFVYKEPSSLKPRMERKASALGVFTIPTKYLYGDKNSILNRMEWDVRVLGLVASPYLYLYCVLGLKAAGKWSGIIMLLR